MERNRFWMISVLMLVFLFLQDALVQAQGERDEKADAFFVVITNIKADPSLYERYKRMLEEIKQELEILANRAFPPNIRLMPETDVLRFICAGAACEAEKQKLIEECSVGGCKVLAERVPADYFIFSELEEGEVGKLSLRLYLFDSQSLTLDKAEIEGGSSEAIRDGVQLRYPDLLSSLVRNAGGGVLEISHLATVEVKKLDPSSGVMVFLDGRFKTSSPETGEAFSFPVPSGKALKVQFRKAGYREETLLIPALKDGEIKTLDPIRLAPGETGRIRQAAILNIVSDPAGAEIWIDGIDTGKKTPADISLESGKYALMLKKEPLYLTKMIPLDLTERKKLDITRELATLTKLSCRVAIDSNPSGATIVVRGNKFFDQGMTPYRNEAFPVGTFEVELSKGEASGGFQLKYHDLKVSLTTEADKHIQEYFKGKLAHCMSVPILSWLTISSMASGWAPRQTVSSFSSENTASGSSKGAITNRRRRRS